MNPRLRVITKIGAFSFALFFIFFFVVHGYRYTNGVGFVTKNAFYEVTFRSNSHQLKFDGVDYNPIENKIQLYNLDDGCYAVEYNGKKFNQCISRNSVTFDALVTYVGTYDYEPSVLKSCKRVVREKHGLYELGGMRYSTPIQSVFYARDVAFLQTNDTLYSCTHDFQRCHEVAPLEGDVVCSNADGLIYNKDGKLYIAELQ